MRMLMELVRLDPSAWTDRTVEFAGQATVLSKDLDDKPIHLNIQTLMSRARWEKAGHPVQLAVDLDPADLIETPASL